MKLSISPATRLHLWSLLLLAALILLYFHPIFLGRQMALRDVNVQFGPKWLFLKEMVLAGRLPLWNPYTFCGYDFVVDPQSAVFYPFTYLFVFFSIAAATHLYIMLHVLIFAFSGYLLAGDYGSGLPGRLLAGMVLIFSGFTLKCWEFLPYLGAIAWAPLLLLFLKRALDGAHLGYAAAAGVCLALQLLAGNPYPLFYFCLAAGLYALFRWATAPPPRLAFLFREAKVLAVAALTFLGLTAAQVLPTAHAVLSAPAAALKTRLPEGYSLHPVEYLNFLVPRFFGFPDWQKCIYFGIAPLLCCACAAWALRPSTRPTLGAAMGRDAFFFFGLALLALVLAGGGYLGIDAAISEAIPLFSRFMKWPTHAMALFVLASALLSGAGLTVFLKQAEGGSDRTLNRVLASGWLALAGAGALVALDWLTGAGWLDAIRARHFIELLGMRSADITLDRYPLFAELLRFLVLLAICLALLTAFLRWPTRRPILTVLLLAVTAVDLLTFSLPLFHFSREAIYEREPEAARYLTQQMAQEGLFRIHSVAPSAVNDRSYGSRTLSDYLLARESLYGSVASQYHLFDTGGTDTVKPERYVAFLDQAQALLPDEAGIRLLGLLNVKYLVNLPKQTASGDLDPSLLLLPETYTLPRAYWVPEPATVPEDPEALRRLADPTHDPRHTVLLADGPPNPPPIGATAAPEGRVSSVTYTANAIRLEAEAPAGGWLVLAERFSDGWRAQVDGRSLPIHRANLVQMAVALPPGARTVSFHYSQPGLYPGLFISIVTLVALAILAVWVLRRPKGMRPCADRQSPP